MLPADLPVSGFMVVCPLIAAVYLSHREGNAGELLRRVFARAGVRPAVWYLPILLLAPAITLIAYWMTRATGNYSAPDTGPGPLAMVALFVGLLVAAACEEAGWTGYALEPLRRRFGRLGTGLVLGCVWALWHAVPWAMVHGLEWAAWQCLFSVAARVIMVWLYESSGRSVLSATLFHFTINVGYVLSEANYDPEFVAAVTVVVAAFVSVRPRGG
ncbi:CPBP family intramembrane glutamic endopeptidase [Pseudonocardia acaciae]|uniref:CPBP family intramembrane glutamic endopeptidase n=1 Tax=Pseudonocardia acaciae TaxID=551276 RepID=UPI0006882A69|nr:CPBP family intramembrane glutamic endopeptidase [Pseudonocardia acaciae]